jgi:hypothetical protein
MTLSRGFFRGSAIRHLECCMWGLRAICSSNGDSTLGWPSVWGPSHLSDAADVDTERGSLHLPRY